MAASSAMRTVHQVWHILRPRVGRHHQGALGLAWGICLIGWLGIALLPNPYQSTAVLTPIDPATAATLAVSRQHLRAAGKLVGGPAGQGDRVPDAWLQRVTRQLSVSSAPGAPITISFVDEDARAAQRILAAVLAATLGAEASPQSGAQAADLAAARALRADYAQQLAAIPAVLDPASGGTGGANPMHARLQTQLAQQDALIASLEQTRAGRRLPADQDGRFQVVEPPTVPVRVRPWTGLLLAAVFWAGIGCGGAWVILRGGQDQVFDSVGQLERRLGRPVLGSLPLLRGRADADRWSTAGAVTVLLALMTAFASVMTLELSGWFAVFGATLRRYLAV